MAKTDWAGLSDKIDRLLRLKTSPVAYKRLEKLAELEKIPDVMPLGRRASFCQVPALVRTMGMTISATRENFPGNRSPGRRRPSPLAGLPTWRRLKSRWRPTP